MDEDVLPVVRRDKPEALLVIEPLHFARGHVWSHSFQTHARSPTRQPVACKWSPAELRHNLRSRRALPERDAAPVPGDDA